MNTAIDSFDNALDTALNSPKYNLLTGRIPNIREAIGNFARVFFNRFILPILEKLRLPDISDIFTSPGLLKGIFTAVAIAVLIGIIFYIMRARRRLERRDKSMEEIFDNLANNITTYQQLLSTAGDFAAEGKYRDAIRYEYIALLWVFNQCSVIFLRDSKTNSQLKREVKTNAEEFYTSFCHLVDVFNYTWFGHKDIAAEEYGQCRTEALYLIGEARQYEKKN